MVLYFFYKNILLTLPHFLFSFMNGFSGQTIFDDYYITFFNMQFTFWPLFIRGIQDLDVDLCIDGEQYKPFIPKLYYVGQERALLNKTTFAIWQTTGIIQTCLIYFITIKVFNYEHIDNSYGGTSEMWMVSLTIFTSIIIVINLKITLLTRYNTILTFFAMVTTIINYTGYMWTSTGRVTIWRT